VGELPRTAICASPVRERPPLAAVVKAPVVDRRAQRDDRLPADEQGSCRPVRAARSAARRRTSSLAARSRRGSITLLSETSRTNGVGSVAKKPATAVRREGPSWSAVGLAPQRADEVRPSSARPASGARARAAWLGKQSHSCPKLVPSEKPFQSNAVPSSRPPRKKPTSPRCGKGTANCPERPLGPPFFARTHAGDPGQRKPERCAHAPFHPSPCWGSPAPPPACHPNGKSRIRFRACANLCSIAAQALYAEWKPRRALNGSLATRLPKRLEEPPRGSRFRSNLLWGTERRVLAPSRGSIRSGSLHPESVPRARWCVGDDEPRRRPRAPEELPPAAGAEAFFAPTTVDRVGRC